MMFGILLFIFVVVCILLMFFILVQSDKGGGISGAIGGGFASASNMIGSQDTANILTRGTTILASIFLGLCLILSVFLSHPSDKQVKSSLKTRAEKQGSFSPASVLQGQQTLPMGATGGAAPAGDASQPQGFPQGIPMPEATPSQAPAK